MKAILDAIRSGASERTVPRVYRALIGVRHLAPPLYRMVIARNPRCSGSRD